MTLLVNNFPDIIAILPAAGIGRRMQISFPKQYLKIGGKTLLEHAIYALMQQPCIQKIIVVINQDDNRFTSLSIVNDSRILVVNGGKQRADSVMAGLLHADKVSWVIVQDASRPFLHQDDLTRLLDLTKYSKVGGILATPVRDTIKQASNNKNLVYRTLERKNLWHALTPQLFALPLLKRCLSIALSKGVVITDEASALEYCGYKPVLIKGRSDNIKITCLEDFLLAKFYFSELNCTQKEYI